MNSKESITESEKVELVRLLSKIKNTEITGDIWYEMVKKWITVPVELCILDGENRVFLVYRKDREFEGYHMPGTVVNDWETVKEATRRLVEREVMKDAGLTISTPKPIGWLEIHRGNGQDENVTRNQISLLHIAYLEGGYVPLDGNGFFALDELPDMTLHFHKYMLSYFKRYLGNGKVILGE